jgi:hypothetical protein
MKRTWASRLDGTKAAALFGNADGLTAPPNRAPGLAPYADTAKQRT